MLVISNKQLNAIFHIFIFRLIFIDIILQRYFTELQNPIIKNTYFFLFHSVNLCFNN